MSTSGSPGCDGEWRQAETGQSVGNGNVIMCESRWDLTLLLCFFLKLYRRLLRCFSIAIHLTLDRGPVCETPRAFRRSNILPSLRCLFEEVDGKRGGRENKISDSNRIVLPSSNGKRACALALCLLCLQLKACLRDVGPMVWWSLCMAACSHEQINKCILDDATTSAVCLARRNLEVTFTQELKFDPHTWASSLDTW